DVGGRLQRNLRPGRDPLVALVQELEGPLVVVADEVSPSIAAQLDWSKVRGLVCDVGSPTHHTVILVRSLGIPTVVGLGSATHAILPGQTVAIDGATGEVVVEPDQAALERWKQRAQLATAALQKLGEWRSVPAATADGLRVRLDANLEIAEEVGRVLDVGAEGIGLYRSEFLLDRAPASAGLDEETQLETYSRLLKAMSPRPVTIRTFDAGEERWEPHGGGHRERFGLRGVRAALQHDDRFRVQIRALLRAAPSGKLRILLPFVTSAAEFRQARALIAEIARGLPGAEAVPIGAMIEVPAAALTADQLARDADFLSVGTNDLIQYTLAIDRTDERMSGHYEPREPAVLRLLRMVSVAGRRAGRDLSVCGEMAADPLLVALLVGLGFRAFSMTPAALPVVKRSLRAVDSRLAATCARQAVKAEGAEDVHRLLTSIADVMHAAVAAG
ncbi:MAG: phosphoenolpyruvate--protein phosphotransferase, partial [Vicinamibacterales bacterium]